MAQRTISVRMRYVGFGDLFLVRVPAADGTTRTMLFDCGVHARGARADMPMEKIITRLLDDVRDADGNPTIDVVVATHRHTDHISGFADERWADVRVGEVWMPWTEDPDDTEALGIARRRAAAARRLTEVIGARPKGPLTDLAIGILGEVLAASNAKSVEMLREGFSPLPGRRSVRRRYLAARRRPLAVPGIEGLRVHVLGPARDEDAVRELEPPRDQRYLAPGAPGLASRIDAAFPEHLQCDERLIPGVGSLLTAREREDLAALADDPEGIAAQLHSASNDSSLLLVLEMGRAVLLFAGDAEWRSWRAVLADEKARALLGRTSLFKVGHHGSYNATPVELVEEVLPEKPFWALVPTQAGKPFESIPRLPLLQALTKRGARVVRSDGVDLPRGAGRKEYTVSEDKGCYDVHVPI